MVRRRGPQNLSLVQQHVALEKAWPCGATIRRSVLTANLKLNPSPVSPTYSVSLEYRLGSAPRVHVLEPKLDPRHRNRLPHVYTKDRLCLYYPGEWNGSMVVASTIIPWTAEWLFHYEIWLATDRWAGGGDVYAPPDEDDRLHL